MDLKRSREGYEADVMLLADRAEALRADGWSIERIARQLVDERNRLKIRYRENLPPLVLRRIEVRNLDKYGHVPGPTADWLFARYGDWELVAAAAARPAPLSRSMGVRR